MNEHRDVPDQNVEQKTGQLAKPSTLPEICNAILQLNGKIEKEVATIKEELARVKV